MRKIGLIAVVTILLVLGLAAVAQAATPQDIYNDYADNGKLNGTYTAAELQAYLNDATINVYGNPAVTVPLDALVGQVLGIMQANPNMSFQDALAQALGTSTDDDRDTYPFTGLEVMLVLLGAVVLVGSGLLLRRATR